MNAPPVRVAAEDILNTARLYPQNFDAAGERVLFVPLSEADYNVSSFLDSRLLTPGMPNVWLPLAELLPLRERIRALPLHFIFHTGHVGSTLVSRLLDQLPGVLGLREPIPLRAVADLKDDGKTDWAEKLDLFLALYARGFAGTRQVIVKTTSFVGRMAPDILAARPDARAIYLNLGAEAYVVALLAGTNGPSDLALFAAVRRARLESLLGAPVAQAATTGERAAQAWVIERMAQARAARDARVLAVDFEALLSDLETGLARIAGHFGLPASAETVAALIASPVLRQYSKLPNLPAFSPARRAEKMKAARAQFADDIVQGMAMLDGLARAHPQVADLLSH